MKCKTCQHAIKLHKHPLNRMFNGAISEQVDFIGCVALGKDNGLIVDRVVEECEGWIGKPKPLKMNVDFIGERIFLDDDGKYSFDCDEVEDCFRCIFVGWGPDGFLKCCAREYKLDSIAAHDFDKTEVTIEDLEQFKIK